MAGKCANFIEVDMGENRICSGMDDDLTKNVINVATILKKYFIDVQELFFDGRLLPAGDAYRLPLLLPERGHIVMR